MNVLGSKPYNWILLQEGERLFLSIPCAQSAVSYDFNIELSIDEISVYRHQGAEFLNAFAEAVRDSAPGNRLSFSKYRTRKVEQELANRMDSAIDIAGCRTIL